MLGKKVIKNHSKHEVNYNVHCTFLLRMKRPPLIRTTEEVKIKLDLLEACCTSLIILFTFL